MAARLRVHQSERKAGPSSILSLCCLKRDIHEFAPIVAVLTLSCLAMKTNGCMLRVHPSERYQARSQILSLRTCHDFSMCASQQTSSHAICFSPRYDGKSVFQSNANQARLLMFAPANYSVRNPCFQPSSICVCSSRSQFNQVTQFNQMAFWFFLGLLDCCRKQLVPKISRSKQYCWGFFGLHSSKQNNNNNTIPCISNKKHNIIIYRMFQHSLKQKWVQFRSNKTLLTLTTLNSPLSKQLAVPAPPQCSKTPATTTTTTTKNCSRRCKQNQLPQT
jgi:hypothetical protein